MTRTGSASRRLRSAVLTATTALLVAACSGGADTTPPGAAAAASAPPTASVVPTAWLDAATAAWPDSDGRKDGVMVFGGARQCVLGDQPVHMLDIDLRWSGSGYGPLVPGAAGGYGQLAPGARATGGFVHLCDLSVSRVPALDVPSRVAGQLMLTHYPDDATLQKAVAGFRSQPDTPVQDNEVTQVTSGRYTVDALRRWYPTNPQGAYQTMVVDAPQRATLVLEVNSLSRADFEAASAQKVADALTDFVERSRSAPPATPTPVPDWASSIWADPQDTFHIAVARGWTEDPGPGGPNSLTAIAHIVDADRSASVIVTPSHSAGAPSPALVDKVRAVFAQQRYTIESEDAITLDNGQAAHRFVQRRGDKRLMAVLVTTGTGTYVITAGAPVSRWGDRQDDMLKMVRSFVAEP